MNLRDLWLNALGKVTGQPRPHLMKVLDVLIEEMPGKEKWKEDVPDPKRVAMEKGFEENDSEILGIYVRLLQEHPELQTDRIEKIQTENAKKNRRIRRPSFRR